MTALDRVQTDSGTIHERWPPERFFWAILDAPGFTRGGAVPAGLLPALEEELPLKMSLVHAVCAPVPDHRVLVCAALRAELAAVDGRVRSLSPSALPPGLGIDLDPSSLNLLTGPFEPQAVRHERARRGLSTAAATLLCLLFLVTGLERRAQRWNFVAASADDARAKLIAQALPAGTRKSLAQEAARLRHAAAEAQVLRPPADAAAALALILQAWPSGLGGSAEDTAEETESSFEPVSLMVTGTEASLSVLTDGNPGDFLRGFVPPKQWSLDEPRLASAGKASRLSLHLRSHANLESGGSP